MAKLRVAFFTETLDEVNGITRVINEYIKYANARADLDLEVFTLAAKPSSTHQGNVKIHRFAGGRRLNIPMINAYFPRARANRLFFRYFKKNHFDVIHTAGPAPAGLVALALSRWFNIPLVFSYHTEIPEYSRRYLEKWFDHLALFDFLDYLDKVRRGVGYSWEKIAWQLLSAYCYKCHRILAPSNYTLQKIKIITNRKRHYKLGLFPHGVDMTEFNPRFASAALRRKYPQMVLYVGRVSVEKDLDMLTAIKKGTLVIVGEGPYEKQLAKMIPRAHFLGRKSGRDLAELYASAQVFAFPSTTDTFGLVVLESMASGTAVVCSDKGGPQEIIKDGVNGLITPGRRQADFGRAVDRLTTDTKLARQMGQAAYRSAQHYTWRAVFDALVKDYQKVIRDYQNKVDFRRKVRNYTGIDLIRY